MIPRRPLTIRIGLLSQVLLLLACGGSGNGGDPEPQPDPVIPAPAAATLVFPENNSECTEGVVVSETRSRILFQWNASQNTDSYQVNLRDLDANTSSVVSSTAPEVEITLTRGTPYEWQVISRADGTSETASSPAWRFYNAGPGVLNYAPFPAQAVFPARGSHIPETTTVVLEWTGADVDEDITGYEVFFGTSEDPSEIAGATAETTIEVAVATGTAYFWKVRTLDSQGNTSESEVFGFVVM